MRIYQVRPTRCFHGVLPAKIAVFFLTILTVYAILNEIEYRRRGNTMSVFQILTAIILLVFYACYFAKMLSQKKKGIRTTQIGKGKQGFPLYVEIAMGIATFCIGTLSLLDRK